MAAGENFVQVTEGVGKKLHTWERVVGANNVQDEVVVQGEPYLASYVLDGSGTQMATTTADSHLMQIMAGATLNVRIRRIELWQAAVATAAVLMDVVLVRLSTAGTGGGAVSTRPLDTTDAASGATAMKLPTAKGTELVTLTRASVYMMQTLTASAQLSGPALVWDFDSLHSKPLIIPAGVTNGIAVSNNTAVAGGIITINILFSESTF